AARVTTPSLGRPMSIDQYLATHRAEAAQSQAARITVQWDNASIEDVVAGFAAFSGRTIILGKDIKGNVTAEVKNQPWDLAMYAVLESQGLAVKTLPGGILNVVSQIELARADSTVPITTRLVRVNYAKATSLVPSVASIVTKRGQVVADSSSNSLVITEVTSRIDEVVEFVKGLDQRTPQVSIQAKIIFVDRQDIVNLGVKYDLGSTTQFFNKLIQRPDPRSAKPVDTDLDGVPDALVPTENFPSNQNIVSLGGNSLSALGNAGQEVINPALELIFSTAIGNFDLTTFVQALSNVDLGHPGRADDHDARQPPGRDPRRRPCADPHHRRERHQYGRRDRHRGTTRDGAVPADRYQPARHATRDGNASNPDGSARGAVERPAGGRGHR